MSLTSSELARVEEGTSFADLDQDAGAPFEVRRLESCEVLWLNDEWFVRRGMDARDGETRRRIEQWVRETFGFAVYDNDHGHAYVDAHQDVYADRFGSERADDRRGGSGDSGIFGRFRIRGIGPTPFSAPASAESSLTVAMALDQAEQSKTSLAEPPHGALPVVAVLGASLGEFADPLARRSLTVKPFEPTLGHLMRAPHFGADPRKPSPHQVIDARRCRAAVGRWADGLAAGTALPPETLLRRISEQMAWRRTTTSCAEPVDASDFTLSGQWVNAPRRDVSATQNTASLLGMKLDLGQLTRMAQALVFFFGKYRPPHHPPLPPAAVFMEGAEAHYKSALGNFK